MLCLLRSLFLDLYTLSRSLSLSLSWYCPCRPSLDWHFCRFCCYLSDSCLFSFTFRDQLPSAQEEQGMLQCMHKNGEEMTVLNQLINASSVVFSCSFFFSSLVLSFLTMKDFFFCSTLCQWCAFTLFIYLTTVVVLFWLSEEKDRCCLYMK